MRLAAKIVTFRVMHKEIAEKHIFIGLMGLISLIGPMSLIGLMSLISPIGPMSLIGLMGWLSPGLFHAARNDAPCCPLSRLLEHRPSLAGASARACWSVNPLPSRVYEMLLYGE